MSRKVRLSTTVTYYTQFLLLHCRLHIVLTSLKFKVITFSLFRTVEHAPPLQKKLLKVSLFYDAWVKFYNFSILRRLYDIMTS